MVSSVLLSTLGSFQLLGVELHSLFKESAKTEAFILSLVPGYFALSWFGFVFCLEGLGCVRDYFFSVWLVHVHG